MNITYDTQGSATFMVYSMDPQEQIDNIGLGMITNNKMKGVIPIAFTQFDDVRQLRFNVSSMISLKSFLDVRVTRTRVLNVFSSICDAFIAADDFLLDRDMFMMDPNYIFTYVSSGESKLVYLPIVRETSPIDLCRFFKEMMFTMQTDPGENTEYVAKIINFLNKPEDFNLESFRTLINGLKQEGALPSAPEPSPQMQKPAGNSYSYGEQPVSKPAAPSFPSGMQGGSMSYVPGNSGMQGGSPYNQPLNNPYGQAGGQASAPTTYMNDGNSTYPGSQMQSSQAYEVPSQNSAPVRSSDFEIPGGGTMRQPASPAKEKKVLFTFMGKPIGGGLTKEEKEQWIEEEKRKKEEKKNRKGLFGKKETKSQEMKSRPDFEIPGSGSDSYSAQPQYRQPQYSQPQYGQPQYGQPQYGQPQYSQPQSSQPQYSQPQAPAGGMGGGTVVLNNFAQSQGTTILNPSMNTMGGAPILSPYLIRVRTNEEIRITKDTFRIGKERSYVDYFILDNPTVSRSHADIVKRGSEYFIKDNNSMNHTFMEGQQLEPNREYPLKSGTHFILSNEEFEFKLR